MPMRSLLIASLIILSMSVYAHGEDATLHWADEVILSSLTSAKVVAIKAPAGSVVKKGEAIVLLDSRSAEARLELYRDKLKTRRALLEEAKAELKRAQQMFQQTMLSEHDLTLAKIGKSKAEAEYQDARAGLALAEQEMDDTRITADSDARVLEIYVEEGQTMNSRMQSQAIARVASATQMEVHRHIAPKQALGLSPGKVAEIKVDGKSYQGKIKSITWPKTMGEPVRVDLIFEVGRNASLLPGMSADIHL